MPGRVSNLGVISTVIRVESEGARAELRKTGKALRDASRAAKGLQRAGYRLNRGIRSVERRLTSFHGILALATGATGVGFAIKEFARLADTMTHLESRLRIVSDGQQNLRYQQEALFGVSQRSRSTLHDTINLYVRTALATRRLGIEQSRLLKFVESVNRALIISGATSTEIEAFTIQFTQGLASGTLQGDELRSVLEQAPAVSEALARGLGVDRGQLRSIGEQRQLTAPRIIQAILSQTSTIADDFFQIQRTVGQAGIQVRNQIEKIIQDVNRPTEVGGASRVTGVLVEQLDRVRFTLTNTDVQDRFFKALEFGANAAGLAANNFGAILTGVVTYGITRVVTSVGRFILSINALRKRTTSAGDAFRSFVRGPQFAFTAVIASLVSVGAYLAFVRDSAVSTAEQIERVIQKATVTGNVAATIQNLRGELQVLDREIASREGGAPAGAAAPEPEGGGVGALLPTVLAIASFVPALQGLAFLGSLRRGGGAARAAQAATPAAASRAAARGTDTTSRRARAAATKAETEAATERTKAANTQKRVAQKQATEAEKTEATATRARETAAKAEESSTRERTKAAEVQKRAAQKQTEDTEKVEATATEAKATAAKAETEAATERTKAAEAQKEAASKQSEDARTVEAGATKAKETAARAETSAANERTKAAEVQQQAARQDAEAVRQRPRDVAGEAVPRSFGRAPIQRGRLGARTVHRAPPEAVEGQPAQPVGRVRGERSGTGRGSSFGEAFASALGDRRRASQAAARARRQRQEDTERLRQRQEELAPTESISSQTPIEVRTGRDRIRERIRQNNARAARDAEKRAGVAELSEIETRTRIAEASTRQRKVEARSDARFRAQSQRRRPDVEDARRAEGAELRARQAAARDIATVRREEDVRSALSAQDRSRARQRAEEAGLLASQPTPSVRVPPPPPRPQLPPEPARPSGDADDFASRLAGAVGTDRARSQAASIQARRRAERTQAQARQTEQIEAKALQDRQQAATAEVSEAQARVRVATGRERKVAARERERDREDGIRRARAVEEEAAEAPSRIQEAATRQRQQEESNRLSREQIEEQRKALKRQQQATQAETPSVLVGQPAEARRPFEDDDSFGARLAGAIGTERAQGQAARAEARRRAERTQAQARQTEQIEAKALQDRQQAATAEVSEAQSRVRVVTERERKVAARERERDRAAQARAAEEEATEVPTLIEEAATRQRQQEEANRLSRTQLQQRQEAARIQEESNRAAGRELEGIQARAKAARPAEGEAPREVALPGPTLTRRERRDSERRGLSSRRREEESDRAKAAAAKAEADAAKERARAAKAQEEAARRQAAGADPVTPTPDPTRAASVAFGLTQARENLQRTLKNQNAAVRRAEKKATAATERFAEERNKLAATTAEVNRTASEAQAAQRESARAASVVQRIEADAARGGDVDRDLLSAINSDYADAVKASARAQRAQEKAIRAHTAARDRAGNQALTAREAQRTAEAERLRLTEKQNTARRTQVLLEENRAALAAAQATPAAPSGRDSVRSGLVEGVRGGLGTPALLATAGLALSAQGVQASEIEAQSKQLVEEAQRASRAIDEAERGTRTFLDRVLDFISPLAEFMGTFAIGEVSGLTTQPLPEGSGIVGHIERQQQEEVERLREVRRGVAEHLQSLLDDSLQIDEEGLNIQADLDRALQQPIVPTDYLQQFLSDSREAAQQQQVLSREVSLQGDALRQARANRELNARIRRIEIDLVLKEADAVRNLAAQEERRQRDRNSSTATLRERDALLRQEYDQLVANAAPVEELQALEQAREKVLQQILTAQESVDRQYARDVRNSSQAVETVRAELRAVSELRQESNFALLAGLATDVIRLDEAAKALANEKQSLESLVSRLSGLRADFGRREGEDPTDDVGARREAILRQIEALESRAVAAPEQEVTIQRELEILRERLGVLEQHVPVLERIRELEAELEVETPTDTVTDSINETFGNLKQVLSNLEAERARLQLTSQEALSGIVPTPAEQVQAESVVEEREIRYNAENAEQLERQLSIFRQILGVRTEIVELQRIANEITEAANSDLQDFQRRFNEDRQGLVRTARLFSRALGRGIEVAITKAESLGDVLRGLIGEILGAVSQSLANRILTAFIPRSPISGLVGNNSPIPSGVFAPGRQSGGPTYSGRSYLVGERGPELFVPGERGQVVPQGQRPGSGIVVNAPLTINVQSTDGPGVERAIDRARQEIRAETVDLALSRVAQEVNRPNARFR